MQDNSFRKIRSNAGPAFCGITHFPCNGIDEENTLTDHLDDPEIVDEDPVTALAKKMLNDAYDFDTAWDELPEKRARALLYAKAAHEHFSTVIAAHGGQAFTAADLADLRNVLWENDGHASSRARLRRLVPAIDDAIVVPDPALTPVAAALDTDTPCQHTWVHAEVRFTTENGNIRGPFDGEQCTSCPAVRYGGQVFDPALPEPKSCTGGQPFHWSAFGARYPDTVCVDGQCADLGADYSTAAGIACPFCDPSGFFDYQFGGAYTEPTCGTCGLRGIDPAEVTFHDGPALTCTVFCSRCASEQPAAMREYPPTDAQASLTSR